MLPLWQQPKNAVIVPLGVPAPFPLLDGLRTEFQISRNGMKNTIHVAVAEGALHKRKSVATRTFFSASSGAFKMKTEGTWPGESPNYTISQTAISSSIWMYVAWCSLHLDASFLS